MKTYPLLQSQMSVFMGWQMHPETTAWNLPSVISFPKSVGLKRLQEAAKRITRHKATHTRFVKNGMAIRQYCDPDMTIPIPTRRMTETEAEAYMANDFVKPFQPFGPFPLCRIEIIETPQRLLLLTDYHHTIADGTSIVRMMTEEDEERQMEMTEAAEAEEAAFQTKAYQVAREYMLEHFQGTQLTTFATPHRGQAMPWGRHLMASCTMARTPIDEWCKLHETKVSIVFTAAFSIVLSKLTRQQRVAFFTLTHGRTDARMRRSFGMFVRSLPLLADTDGDMLVMDFIQRLQQEQRTALKNNVYPATHFCRDTQTKPAITFGFQGREIEEVCWLDDIPYKGTQLDHKEACNDLNCTIYSSNGNYEIRTDASEALVKQATLQMVAQAVATCLQQMMEFPNGRLQDICLIDDNEQQRLITLGQGERTSPQKREAGERTSPQKEEEGDEPTWTDLFRRQAALTPDNIAVVAEDGSLTYRELDQLSSLYAAKLDKQRKAEEPNGQGKAEEHNGEGKTKEPNGQGNRNSPFVCLTTTRTKEWMVQVIGVLKAGLAFVPIDAEWPEARRRQIFETTLTSPSSSASAHSINETSFRTDLAYMMFTSGSTGKPKGVMITHRGLFNLTRFITRRWNLTNLSRISCHAPLSFDASIEDLFPVLTVGGTLYIVPDNIRMNLAATAQYLKDNGITGGCYTTRLGVMLAEHHQLQVEYLCLGGEKLNLPLISAQGTPAFPANYRIINTYGPTECTVDATYYEVPATSAIDSHDCPTTNTMGSSEGRNTETTSIPIGRPLDNMQVLVVDQHGQLLPQGATGELWIAGPQVAAGYWNEPELTNRMFTSCRFCKGKVYHTGDLVKWNEEGLLEFVGRTDQQIKRNGFRIEPEEIASALLQLEGITQAVVKLVTLADQQAVSTSKRELLCAYFTADKEMDVDDIRRKLKKLLPDYLIPDILMQLTEIPLNANGKTDDERLPEPTIPERLYVRPANEREQLLCRTFAKVLQTDQVGATDNFFDLGGTSLSVMLLLGELEKAGIHLTYQEVFNNPTPRSLSTPRTPAPACPPRPVCCDSVATNPSCPPRPVCCDSVATHPALNKNEWGAAPFILTGATGFLGIHILHELINHDAQQVCCLVRDKDGIKAEERLRNRIRTYFGEESSMLSLLGSRIQVVCGDITSALSFNRLPFPPLSPSTDVADAPSTDVEDAPSTDATRMESAPSTLIHCAADVRYFAQGTAVEDTNIKGTENVIRFCLATGTRLIHISTTSLNALPQEQQDENLPAQLNTTMLEQQGITAQGLLSLPYLQSKRAAEELVLRAANEQLLDAHIIRIGSLMPRLSDGMFQVNAQDNLFMRLLNVIQQTGTCAASLADYPFVCAPVDVVAQAIVKGCYEATPPIKWVDTTPRPLREIIAERNGGDKRLRLVSDEEFLSLTQHSV